MGYTYLPNPLKDGVDNVGYALVNFPMVTSDKARIRVSCKNNVFFAVTPTNISIVP